MPKAEIKTIKDLINFNIEFKKMIKDEKISANSNDSDKQNEQEDFDKIFSSSSEMEHKFERKNIEV